MAQFGAIYLSFNEASIGNVEDISDTLKKNGFLFIVRVVRMNKNYDQLFEPITPPTRDYARYQIENHAV